MALETTLEIKVLNRCSLVAAEKGEKKIRPVTQSSINVIIGS